MNDRRLSKRVNSRLARLPLGARQELLRVLASSSDVRADLIRQMYERSEARDLAKVLMDLEAEPEMRVRVMEALKDSADKGLG
jgi:DNA mismatch repair ATPase MutS